NPGQGSTFWTLGQAVRWSHDTLNRAIFPNKGGQQRLSGLVMIPGSDLEYYKVGYRHQHYFPLAKDFTFKLNGEVAYGDGYGNTNGLPFFDNYFMGGTGSVRGFKNNTLGPRDSNGNPIGGSSKIIGNAELFFPVPFLSETKSVRLGTFFDAGALNDSFSINNMKYSAGISGEWLSPFGALSVSAAYPLNKGTFTYNTYNPAQGVIPGTDITQNDQTQFFQFNFGQNF
ncbi:MAG: BamA/TamA family outer membrane protein, partial [Methylococcaceae bacterium]|nr:BamA/TamA family outer membrane protein [Methylococcaceae bacterium]